MSNVLSAVRRAISAVRADHQMLCHYDRKYATDAHRESSLARALVQRAGFQMLVGYRTARCLSEAGVPLAPQLVSRAVRFLYGADIHWNASIAEGVVVVHGMGICISPSASVGTGCILMQNVTLGEGRDAMTGATGGPKLGERVHVGPGATIVGPVAIGNDTKIMASCVVGESVDEGSIVESPKPRVRPRGRSIEPVNVGPKRGQS